MIVRCKDEYSRLLPDSVNPPGDVTRLLTAWAEGDEHAMEQLMPLVYDELHRIARYHWNSQPEGHRLQPTALIHEAFLKQAKFTASEPLAREVMVIEQKKRPGEWQGFLAESLLGASLAGQKKCAAAEPMLLAGFKGMDARKDRIPVAERPAVERSRAWIAGLYQAWGRPAEAAVWMKK